MLLKNRLFSSLGSSIEWFDFALYGFLGPIFAQVFFAHNSTSSWNNLIITYAVFAAGYLARPIGAFIFGYLGDRFGRLFALRLTPLFMTLTTLIMAFLPTYKAVGTLAIYLLLLTRIIQGIFLGGEFSGNIVYLCESSNKWKYFWGSIGSCTGSFGIIIASAVASIFYSSFSKPFMLAYGWRIAFLVSVPLGIICLIMRLNMSENPSFQHSTNKHNPIKTTFKHHKALLAKCLGLIYLHATSYYFIFMFLPIALTKIKHIPQGTSLVKNTAFLIIHLCAIPILGLVVNFIGGKKTLIFIAFIFLITITPLSYLLDSGDHTLLLLSILFLSLASAFNAAVIPGLLAEITPPNVRYTIIAITFNVGFGFFGGITPVLSLLIIKKTSAIITPSFYIAFAALITLISGIIIAKRTRKSCS